MGIFVPATCCLQKISVSTTTTITTLKLVPVVPCAAARIGSVKDFQERAEGRVGLRHNTSFIGEWKDGDPVDNHPSIRSNGHVFGLRTILMIFRCVVLGGARSGDGRRIWFIPFVPWIVVCIQRSATIAIVKVFIVSNTSAKERLAEFAMVLVLSFTGIRILL